MFLSQSPKRKPVLIIGVIIVALAAVAAFFWFQTARSPAEGTAELQTPQSADSTPQTTAVAGEETGDTEVPGVSRRLNDSQKSAESPPLQPPRVEEPEIVPRDVAVNNYKTELWAEIQAMPPELRDLNDPEVDAELAYRLYMFYGNCSVVPRTEAQVERRLESIAQRVEHAVGKGLQGMEGRVDGVMSNYELCSQIPPEVDCRLEAVHWMTRAVQLGHDVAEIQFYDRAMGFILRPDPFTNDPPLAMQQPGLVPAFKATARMGLSRALKKGHPEAYLANSQALLEGLIYPKNPMEALAYARAAELAAARYRLILEDLDYWKESAAQQLTEAQIGEAEDLALKLQ